MKINKYIGIVLSVIAVLGIAAILIVTRSQSELPKIDQAADLIDDEAPQTPVFETSGQTTPTPELPPQNITQETAAVPNDWGLIVNKKYGFSYRQPNQSTGEYFSVDTLEKPGTLKSFVQDIWSLNKNEISTYSVNKKISNISEVNINAATGYQFTLSGSYISDAQGSGYILNEPTLYTFFETKTGIKIITRLPLANNNYGTTILSSFKVDYNLVPKNAEPASWQTVNQGSFSFKFPSNLFKISAEYTDRNAIHIMDIEEGMRGNISISTKNEKFNPENITGMYGPIENPEKILIGDMVWYSYLWGDAGAASRIYLTNIGDETLQVSFGSFPEENVYPIYNDSGLQKMILETISGK